MQKIWKHILTSKALRLWGWDWVQESKIERKQVHVWHYRKIEFWELKAMSDDVWPNIRKRCGMKKKWTFVRTRFAEWTFVRTRFAEWKKWKKTKNKTILFIFFVLKVHPANLVRTKVHSVNLVRTKVHFFILKIWSDMKVHLFCIWKIWENIVSSTSFLLFSYFLLIPTFWSIDVKCWNFSFRNTKI